jgi:DNA-binding transcriptional LysR family regulator
MSNLKRLVVFATVVEENSFAAAARKLGITNAAVSKQVMALEDELKAQLLHRTTRRLKLTEEGTIYFEHAKRIVKEMREIESLFLDIKGEPSGHIKVVTARHFAEYYIIPHLDEFLKLYPKISLELLIQERLLDMAKEGIDVNVGHAFVGGPDDIHRKIAEVKYAFCASPAYLEKFGTPKTPEDLHKHRYITHRNRVPNNVLKFRNKKEIRIDPFLRLDDSRMMIACAKKGLGIIKLHRYAMAEDIKRGELVEILDGWDTSIQPIYLCYQPQRYVHRKIRTFIDFFCAKVIKETY